MKTIQVITIQITIRVYQNKTLQILVNCKEKTLLMQDKLLKLIMIPVRETQQKEDRFLLNSLHNQRRQLNKKKLK